MPKAATASMGICGCTTDQKSEDAECRQFGLDQGGSGDNRADRARQDDDPWSHSDPSVAPHRAALYPRWPLSRADMLPDHAPTKRRSPGPTLRILACIGALFTSKPSNVSSAGRGQPTRAPRSRHPCFFCSLNKLYSGPVGDPGILLFCRSSAAPSAASTDQWPCDRDECDSAGGNPARADHARAAGSRGPWPVATGQPGSINVPIRSAGQTRLTGALVSASKEGSLPSGRSTM